MNEVIRAIHFAATQPSVPVVTAKITGMSRFALLEKASTDEPLNEAEQHEWDNLIKRVDSFCYVGRDKGIAIFIDAEESWIQPAIDRITDKMMERYNREKVVVYNTFQMYRNDRLEFLKASHQRALDNGYMLGAKLVRGAYMDKERKRATEKGYASPINPDKATTDAHYNAGITYCIENYQSIASCNATHNAESSMLQAHLMASKKIPTNHPHLNYCQLYGMSDNITFNLSQAGYNAAKYLPYGSIKEVIPYLIRRAQENSSVTGDMSREYGLLHSELKRRKLA